MRITICLVTAITLILLSAAHAEENKEPEFRSIDLQAKANFVITGINQLAELAKQQHKWDDIPFTFGAKGLRLAGEYYPEDPKKIEGIKVGHPFRRFYIVHAAKHGGPGHRFVGQEDYVEDGTLIGQYQVIYEDDLIGVVPIVYGVDVRDWWDWDVSEPVKRGKIIWYGETPDSMAAGMGVRLYLSTWKNPRPDKKVVSITMVSVGDSAASPFCVAMTTKQK